MNEDVKESKQEDKNLNLMDEAINNLNDVIDDPNNGFNCSTENNDKNRNENKVIPTQEQENQIKNSNENENGKLSDNEIGNMNSEQENNDQIKSSLENNEQECINDLEYNPNLNEINSDNNNDQNEQLLLKEFNKMNKLRNLNNGEQINDINGSLNDINDYNYLNEENNNMDNNIENEGDNYKINNYNELNNYDELNDISEYNEYNDYMDNNGDIENNINQIDETNINNEDGINIDNYCNLNYSDMYNGMNDDINPYNENNNFNNIVNDNNNDYTNFLQNEYTFNNNLNKDVYNILELKRYIASLEKKLNISENKNKELKLINSNLQNNINNNNLRALRANKNNANLIAYQKQNKILYSKLQQLSAENKEISQELCKAKEIINSKNSDNNINNPNKNLDSNSIIKNSKKCDEENELLISKLKLDNKFLLSKIDALEKDHKNEKELMLHYKNNEIQTLQKIILSLKKNNNSLSNSNSNNNNLNHLTNNNNFYMDKIFSLEKKSDELTDYIYNLEKENKNYKSKNEIFQLNLQHKNKIINILTGKINTYENELNKKNEARIRKLKMERDTLLRNTNELTNSMNTFNEKIKETKRMYNDRNFAFNRILFAYKKKLKEYKAKIILLKKKVNELYTLNEKLKYSTNRNLCNTQENYISKIKKNKSVQNMLFNRNLYNKHGNNEDINRHRGGNSISGYNYNIEKIRNFKNGGDL